MDAAQLPRPASALVDAIRESAKVVYRQLGAGYDETVYEEAMAIEMRERDLSYEIERTLEIFYKKEKVGTHRVDFVVGGQVVVELKAVASISKSHVAQLRAHRTPVVMADHDVLQDSRHCRYPAVGQEPQDPGPVIAERMLRGAGGGAAGRITRGSVAHIVHLLAPLA